MSTILFRQVIVLVYSKTCPGNDFKDIRDLKEYVGEMKLLLFLFQVVA